MKKYFLFAVVGWVFLLVQPADAKRIASSDNNCRMQEQVTINVSFNSRVGGFTEAKKYFDTRRQKIEGAAKKEGIEKLMLQNQNYNISAERNYDSDGEDYRINGNVSYQLDNFDNAIKLAEALKKEKLQVSINSNAYRRGNCQQEISSQE